MPAIYTEDELISQIEQVIGACPGPANDPGNQKLLENMLRWEWSCRERLGPMNAQTLKLQYLAAQRYTNQIGDYAFRDEVRKLYRLPPLPVGQTKHRRVWPPALFKALKILGGILGIILYLFLVNGGAAIFLGKTGGIIVSVLIIALTIGLFLYGLVWPKIKGFFLGTQLDVMRMSNDRQDIFATPGIYKGMKCPNCDSYLTVGRFNYLYGHEETLDREALKNGILRCKKCGTQFKLP